MICMQREPKLIVQSLFLVKHKAEYAKKIDFNQTLPNFAFSWMGDIKVEKDSDKAYVFLGF